MPKLPGEDSFGGLPSARSGRPIASVDTSAQYAGAESLAQSLTQVGQRLLTRVTQERQRTAAYSANTRYEEFRFAEAQRYEDASSSIPAGEASGFAESYAAGYRERAREFLSTVPPDLQPDIDSRLFDTERQLFASGLEFEQAETLRFTVNALEDTLNNSVLPRVQTATTEADLATIVADGNRLIDGNPAMTPAERDEAKRSWEERAQRAFLNELPADERSGWLGTLPGPSESVAYLTSRGSNLQTTGLDADFSSRLTRALQAAEAATGATAQVNDLVRSAEDQAQYYANYTQQPVVWAGVTYRPQEQGGLAAAPGVSRHQSGAAADIQSGPVLEWLHENADDYGLSFLSGDNFTNDPGHIQMAGEFTGSLPAARLDAISYEDRVTFAADADAAVQRQLNAEAAAAQNVADGRINNLMVGILDGSAGLTDVLSLRREGILTDYDDIKRAVDALEARDGDVMALQEALGHLTDPAFTYNPFDTEHEEEAELAYKALGGADDLLTPPGEPRLFSWTKPENDPHRQALSRLVAVVDRTQIVPDAALTALRGGMYSQNATTRDAAMSVLTRLDQAFPEALERSLSETDLTRLRAFQTLAPLLTPEELATRFAATTDPREAERVAALRVDGLALARKVETQTVLNHFDPSWLWGGTPREPIQPQETAELRNDYEAAFAEFYSLTGNEEASHEQALARLDRKWSISDVGSDRRLVAYAPEQQYPTLSGSHDWMKEDLRSFVEAEFGEEVANYGIVSTYETEAALGTMRVPYRVVAIDRDGIAHVAVVEFEYDRARLRVLSQFVDDRAAAAAGGSDATLSLGNRRPVDSPPQPAVDAPAPVAQPAPAPAAASTPAAPPEIILPSSELMGSQAPPPTRILGPPGVPTTPQELLDLSWAREQTDADLIQARDQLTLSIAATDTAPAAVAAQSAPAPIALPATIPSRAVSPSTRITQAINSAAPAAVNTPPRVAANMNGGMPATVATSAAPGRTVQATADIIPFGAARAATPAAARDAATPATAAVDAAARPATPASMPLTPSRVLSPAQASDVTRTIQQTVATLLSDAPVAVELSPVQARDLANRVTAVILQEAAAAVGAPAPAPAVSAPATPAASSPAIAAQSRQPTAAVPAPPPPIVLARSPRPALAASPLLARTAPAPEAASAATMALSATSGPPAASVASDAAPSIVATDSEPLDAAMGGPAALEPVPTAGQTARNTGPRFYALPADTYLARRDQVEAMVAEVVQIIATSPNAPEGITELDTSVLAEKVMAAIQPALQVEIGPNGEPIPAATLEERRLDVTMEVLGLLNQQRIAAERRAAAEARARLMEQLLGPPLDGAPGVAPPMDPDAPKPILPEGFDIAPEGAVSIRR